MLVNSLEAKLDSTLNRFQNQLLIPTEARQAANNGYVREAAQPARTQAHNDNVPVSKYTTMARRIENTARTATQTNGNLVRLYVRDWRSEPVGRVKKAPYDRR